MKVLDIGCGSNKVKGALGMDFNANLDADIIHDLNLFPYPLNDDEFDHIYISNTLFLLNNPIKIMEEVYRVLKLGGGVTVIQPYFRSVFNFIDPYVKNFGTAHSFAFYDPDDPIFIRYQYTKAKFKTISISFDDGLKKRLITQFVVWFANKYPRRYELYLSHLYPLTKITYKLIKL